MVPDLSLFIWVLENQVKMVRKSPTLRETWDYDSQQDENGCRLATAAAAEMDSVRDLLAALPHSEVTMNF